MATQPSENLLSPLEQREEDRRQLREILAEAGGGDVVRGWRMELDPEGELEVSFAEFCKAAQRLAYIGDVQQLFAGSGDNRMLYLADVAPREAQTLDIFRRWMHARFKDPEEMLQAVSAGCKGAVTRDVFVSGCKRFDYQGDDSEASEVFDMCDVAGAGTLILEDVAFLEMDPHTRYASLFKLKMHNLREWKRNAAKQYIAKKSQAARSCPRSRKEARYAPRVWMEQTFESLPEVVHSKKMFAHTESLRRQSEARDVFLRKICALYGNEVRCLRKALDLSCSYSFSVLDLRKFCRRVELNVCIHSLWKALDVSRCGKVSMEDLCVRPAVALARFRAWVLSTYGGCMDAWEELSGERPADGQWTADRKVAAPKFLKNLKACGCPVVADPELRSHLLACLDLYGCGFIARSDFEWLDGWRPPEWLIVDADYDAWAALREILMQEYGHLLRAWRMLLDRDNSNYLSWREFWEACRVVKFSGSIPGAWRALDADYSGFISMQEYDPSSAALLQSFKDWSETHFGSMYACFKALDVDNSSSVTFAELKRACHKLHWDGDVKLLFACLDIDGKRDLKGEGYGKKSLSWAEISFLDTWPVSVRGGSEDPIASAVQQVATSQSGSVQPISPASSRRASAAGWDLPSPISPVMSQSSTLRGSFGTGFGGSLGGTLGSLELSQTRSSSAASASRPQQQQQQPRRRRLLTDTSTSASAAALLLSEELLDGEAQDSVFPLLQPSLGASPPSAQGNPFVKSSSTSALGATKMPGSRPVGIHGGRATSLGAFGSASGGTGGQQFHIKVDEIFNFYQRHDKPRRSAK